MKRSNKRTVKTALQAAYELLSDKKRWTTNAFFRNRWGKSLENDSDSAERFCLIGAVQHVADPEIVTEIEDLLEKVSRELFRTRPFHLNDHGPGRENFYTPPPEAPTREERHKMVLKVLDVARKRAA